MKNKILGILIIAVVSLTSCSFILNEESETENTQAILTFRATTNVLPSDTHSVRSVFPSNLIEVSNLKNWKLNATYTANGTESTLGTWETYSDFISSAISVKVGEWNFSLTAEGETATYEGTLSKKIIVGENFLNFILASKDGNGSININLYYSTNPNIKAVKAALFNINDGSSVENFGFENLSITDSSDEENYSGLKNVNYQKTSVPTGIYIVTFNFYSDTNCRTLLNTWTETVTVKGDDISSLSQIINLNESYAIYFFVNSGKWINWNNTNWANSSFKDKVGTYNIGASYTPYETVIFPTSENIIRDGYDFEGWYTDSAFAEESKITGWLPETKQESFSVYAKWKLHDYSISYNLNGGTWSDGCVGVSSYTMEDGIISLPASSDFSKDGYFFKGWHLASDFSDENITQIDSTSMEDVQLYAEWYLDNYSILYDLMWNSLAENVTNPNELWAFSYGSQSYDLKDATFTDEKYTFAGWYLNYENGTYSELVTKLDENTALGSDSITLYAKWTITTEKTSSGATVREVQVENLTNEILNLNSEDEFFILVTSESVCAENIRSVNAALKTSSLASFVLDFSGVKEDFVLEDADAENPTNSFYNCTNLTGIILPSSCTGFTSIGKNAFYKTNLYSIVIPKTVTNFCESAFESRNSATGSVYSVYYKGSLNNWMTKLTFADRYSNPLYGDLYVTTGSDENYEKVTELTISNTSGITKIKPYTFSGCKSLDSVKLSSSINTVGDFAFSYSGIKSFSGTSVKELGIATFNACTSLSSVEIGGSIKELKNSLFNMCYSLREFEIPASVTKIDDYAFSASAISTITIPSSVISIGKGAFRSPYPVSQVVITTSGWYVTKTKDSATGTNINLSISSYERAKLLSDTYVEYYWYRSN